MEDEQPFDETDDEIDSGQATPAAGPPDPTDPADIFAAWASSLNDPEDDLADAPTAPYPLPPDDRLWRHPSEIRHLAADSTPPSAPSRVGHSVRTLVVVGIAAGLAAAVLTAGTMALITPRNNTVVERVIERQAVQTSFAATSINATGPAVADIADAVTPSVVRVEVYLGQQIVGSGSGVIFRDDGHVMTNAHVVDSGDAVGVVLANGELLQARIIGADPLTDIAVLKITEAGSEPFIPATLGSTATIRAGEPAIAIGSPLRLLGGPTVTVGVVSAVNRRLQSPNGDDWLYDLVQTDAPISPGSSGGALVDASGAVVGITTIIAVSDVGAEGLGFATPIEIAHAVATDIITWGTARHGLLGVRGENADRDELTPTGRTAGVLVREVDAAGPAGTAGVVPGDIILSLQGVPVTNMSDLVVDARLLDPGSDATLEIHRDGENVMITLVVGELE